MSTTAPEKHVSKRGCLKSRRSRIVLAVVIFIVILAAVIPPVVVTTLHKKNSMGPKSKVFVPLYVYPAPGAWTPLEEVYVSPFQPSPGPVSRSPSCFQGNQSQPGGKPPHTRQGQSCRVIRAPACTVAPERGAQNNHKNSK